MKCAYLGIVGSNSYVVAKDYDQSGDYLVSCKSFTDIFQQISSNVADIGVVPIENTLAGTVYENYDLLFETGLSVIGERILKVDNHLLGTPSLGLTFEQRITSVKKVISHYQPLAQCKNFFNQFPWIEQIAFSDTAASARYVYEHHDPEILAIANSVAAEAYQLEIIKPHIADNDESNFTRFFVISSSHDKPKTFNKCSIVFSINHKPGSLSNMLKILSDFAVNLTKIESRPIHGKPFEYLFYVDFTHNELNKAKFERIYKDIEKCCETLKVIGCYKSSEKII